MSVPDFESQPWEVSVSQVGAGFYVHPVKGLMGTGNWALVGDPSAGPVRRALSYVARVLTGTYLRREWPKNESQLRRAIAECQRYCDHTNAAEAQARRVLRAVEK